MSNSNRNCFCPMYLTSFSSYGRRMYALSITSSRIWMKELVVDFLQTKTSLILSCCCCWGGVGLATCVGLPPLPTSRWEGGFWITEITENFKKFELIKMVVQARIQDSLSEGAETYTTFLIEKILVLGEGPPPRSANGYPISTMLGMPSSLRIKNDSRLSFLFLRQLCLIFFLIRLISNYLNSQFWESHQEPDCVNL